MAGKQTGRVVRSCYNLSCMYRPLALTETWLEHRVVVVVVGSDLVFLGTLGLELMVLLRGHKCVFLGM